MTVYTGSCHCGAIRFEIEGELTGMVHCNCSMCIRRSAVMHYVEPANFTLRSGQEQLATYRFGSQSTANHFCRRCGVFPFFFTTWAGRERYGVNVACLEGVDPYEQESTLIDGRSF